MQLCVCMIYLGVRDIFVPLIMYNISLFYTQITWTKNCSCGTIESLVTIYTSSGDGIPVYRGFDVDPLAISPSPARGSVHLFEHEVVDTGCHNCAYTYTCEIQSYEGIPTDYITHLYTASLNVTLTGTRRPPAGSVCGKAVRHYI